MQLQYVPDIWLLTGSAAVTTGLAVYALRNRSVRGALPFGVCMLVTALWTAAYALELSGADLPTILFWVKVQSTCYSINPVIWLIMVFYFIERERRVNKRNIFILLLIPVITIAAAWTNELHGLMWQNVRLEYSGAYPSFAKSYGPWFWVFAAYSYALNLISEVLLALSFRRKSALYREQSFALFIGLLLLFAANALYIFRVGPFALFDFTPVAAGVSGIIIAWGIFRYRLFDIVPVARENIVEHMADGIIVLDIQNRIADMNQTARVIFGVSSMQSIGWHAKALLEKWPSGEDYDIAELPEELAVEHGGEVKIYEISYLPLSDRRQRQNGLCVILHDVTEKRKTFEQQRQLAASIERERLARDLHDNLGQVFGFINVQAQGIQYELEQAGVRVASQKLEGLIEAARSGHGEMRAYIHKVKNASPSQDLITDLKKEVEKFTEQTNLSVRLDLPDSLNACSLNCNTVPNVLNILREALHNVRKHADAGKVTVEMRVHGDKLLLSVTDDGKGFDAKKYETKPLHGLGLDIMKERAREIGGTLEIKTAPGQGTSILLGVILRKDGA